MLKLLKQFVTDNARRLEQQLSQFEQNVANETQALDAGKMAQPKQLVFTPGSPLTQTLTVGQIALCDTTTGGVTVVLAAPGDGKPGHAWVVRRSAPGVVTIKPSGLSGGIPRTINNATSRVLGAGSAGGPFILYFDGSNWWSV